MKPGGLKALVLGMGPAKGPSESGTDDKPMGEEGTSASESSKGVASDILEAVNAGDVDKLALALDDFKRICGYGDEPDEAAPASEPAEYTKGA